MTRQAIDDVARGSGDSDWQPVKDAATTIAMAEDRAVLHGLDSAGIGGIVPNSSNATVDLPDAVEIIWAPALEGALLVSTRGGDVATTSNRPSTWSSLRCMRRMTVVFICSTAFRATDHCPLGRDEWCRSAEG